MARNKTKFAKSTHELADALGVEPDEALRIARKFPRYRHPDATEAEAAQSLLAQLNECTIEYHTSAFATVEACDAERAVRAVLRVVGRHGVEFIPVVERYVERRRQRKAWQNKLGEAREIEFAFDHMPERFIAEAVNRTQTSNELVSLSGQLARLLKSVKYTPEPNHTLGF